MADLATLSLAIDSRQAVEATIAIDKMAEAAGRGEGKVKQIQTAADALVAALNRNTAATTSLTGRMDLMQASGAKTADALVKVDKAADDATRAMGTLDAASAKTTVALTGTTKAVDAATVAVTKHVAVTPRAADAIKKHSDAANENTRQVGLNSGALQNLSFQINDVATMALSGASAFQIMATQGGQLFQIAQTAGGGVKGIMTQAGEGAAALAARIGLVGAGLGALTAGFATAALAAASYRAQEKTLINSSFGVGEASGATLADLQRSATQASAGGKVTPSQAREVIGELNSQGNINPAVYAKAAESVGLLVSRLGKELPEAQAAVVAGMQPTIAGFDSLNKQFLLGDANLREQLDSMYKSGDAFKAQAIVVDLLNKKLTERTEAGGFFTRGLRAIANTSMFGADPDIERAGAFFGGRVTPEEQLDRARNRVSSIEGRQRAGLPIATTELTSARADVEKLEASLAKTAESSKTAKTTLTSITVAPLVESLNPAQKRIKDISDLAKQMQTSLDNGGKELDKDGTAQRTVDGLKRQAEALTAEFAKGGASLAAGLQQAQFNLKTVGFSDYARKSADIDENDRLARKRIETDNPDPANRAAANKTQDEILATQKALLAESYKQTASVQGGAYSRAPEDVQARIRAAAAKYGVDPGILAGVGQVESTNRLDIGPTREKKADGVTPKTTAWGWGQMTDGAAEDVRNSYPELRNFDKKDESTSIEGAAAYLALRIKRAGNETDGLNGYGTGPGYAQKVRAASGALGGAAPAAIEEADTSRKRALDLERQAVEANVAAQGKNLDMVGASIEVQRKLSDAQAAGRPITQGLIDSYKAEEEARAKLTATSRMAAYTVQGQWDRDQIGRNRVDQVAYSQARFVTNSTDMTTTAAQQVIADSRSNQALLESKNQVSTALGGFASDLMRGATAAQAAAGALGRLADSVLNKVIDSVVSSAFGSIAKGGLASLFPFADGGIMTSAGPLPLHSYATGGIANSPQLALFGEGRGPEAFVPLPDGKRIPVAMSGPANSNATPSQTDARVFNMDLRGSTLTKGEVQSAITQALAANNAENRRTFGQQFSAWKEDN